MRRKENEIVDIVEIEEIIKKSKVCHIGLVDKEEPYIVPVFFGYERGALYFHSSSEGRKVDVIEKNNRVCFEIESDVEVISADMPCGWSAKFRSVMGVGRAYLLEKTEEKAHGLSLLMEHYGENRAGLHFMKLDEVSIVKIEIEHMTGKKARYD